MTTYRPGDVVDVPFPFIDSPEKKLRPALVVTGAPFQNSSGALVLMMITSAERSRWTNDVELTDWSSAGLRKASMVRWKIFTLDEHLIVSRRGTLSLGDQKKVGESIQHAFAHWLRAEGDTPPEATLPPPSLIR